MRRPIKKRPVVSPDIIHGSVDVERLINYIMLRGQKETARKIVYGAFEIIKNDKEGGDPLEVSSIPLSGTRVHSWKYVHVESVVQTTRFHEKCDQNDEWLWTTWIIAASRKQKGVPMHKALAKELMLAAKEEGDAVKKKEDTHKMAEANRAFAHFAW
jgi:small subunit ribosomal protein S7